MLRLSVKRRSLRINDDSLFDIYADLTLIAEAGGLNMGRCKYYRNGNCRRWYWSRRPPELDDGEVKRDYLNGRIVYWVRVEKRPVLCDVCTYFEKKTGYGDVRIRWKPPKGSAQLKNEGYSWHAKQPLDAGASQLLGFKT